MKRKSLLSAYNVPSWATRSKYYMMEFTGALVGLLAVTLLVDWALFALGGYIADTQQMRNWHDTTNLWVVAMLAVWLPVTVLLYRRARYEELARRTVATTKLRRGIMYTFMLLMLFATIGFAISAVQGSLLLLFGLEESNDILLAQVVPAFLAAVLHGHIFRTFMLPNTDARIKELTATIMVAGGVVAAALLVVGFVDGRSTQIDKKISFDLQTIYRKSNDYYAANQSVPDSLNDLSLGADQLRRSLAHNYSYEKTSDTTFRLCADFSAFGQKRPAEEILIYPSPSSSNFFIHDKGRECFDLDSQYALPMIPEDLPGQPRLMRPSVGPAN